MAGTWIATVHGFGGLRVVDGELHLNPTLAPGWTSLGFQVQFRGTWLSVSATPTEVTITNHSALPSSVRVVGTAYPIEANESVTLSAI